MVVYLNTSDTKDTQTTSKSNRLNADLQKAPSCKTKPYAINFRISSIVKTAVKK